MHGLTIHSIASTLELREQAERWDDLWRRSASTRPTAQAEQLIAWKESFAADREFCAVVVTDGERLQAALPLIRSRRWGVAVASTPGNAWTPGGELLLDRNCDPQVACRELLAGLHQFVPGLVELDGLILESLACQSLLAVMRSEKISTLIRSRFNVPLIQIEGSWPAYLAGRSKNHRHQIRNIARRADQLGGVSLERYEAVSPHAVEPLLRECFELEAAGWKGRTNGAVLSDHAAWNYFVRQACGLAETWQLALAVLRHKGHAIAFEYGWQARGVRGVLKIGYDETYARLSPGQLLRARLLENLFAERSLQWVDFLGPANAATGVWATHQYEVGRSLAAIDSFRGRLLIAGSRLARKVSRRKRADQRPPSGKLPIATLPPSAPIPMSESPEPALNPACHST